MNAESIKAWIAERSLEGAQRWVTSLEAAVDELAKSAGSFGMAPESDVFTETLHQFSFLTRSGNRYRLLFVIRAKVVHILAVRTTGQDLLGHGDIELPGHNDH